MFARLRAALVIALVSSAAPAGAESFRLTEPDGTVHFTNAPTDPRYQRMGFNSGTEAGFLRLPQGDTWVRWPRASVVRGCASRVQRV